MEIILTEHAKYKLNLLKEYGFSFTDNQIKKALESPDFVKEAKFNQ